MATGWYLFNYKKPMKEVVYMEFLNDYLLKGQIKEINITKDRRSEVFNFRAEIQTQDGEKFYMTLNSYESFLAKLDLV
jgi:CRISPR/Cas system-associated exonuclease Cas4 (RecB family)